MTYFDNKMAIASELGKARGMVNSLINQQAIVNTDLKPVKKILTKINKLLFKKEKTK